MRIGGFEIGAGQPTFVIAEIGVNHDGSAERALALVEQAANAGANAIKLQVFSADRLMHRSARFAEYQKSTVQAADPVAMLKQYELTADDLQQIAGAARQQGLAVIATPFSFDDVACVMSFADAIKIASPDLVNRLLLSEAAKSSAPLIISTGASTAEEISAAVEWLRSVSADFALLHCVSSYPTPAADVHLSWIGRLNSFGMPVGYSDHTTEPLAGALAVAAGACIIEKHLTYDTSAAGPDHSASFDPVQFKEYVAMIRLADRMRGDGDRRVLPCEEDVRTVSRQSLVVRSNIQKGERITAAHLTTQRPGTGISAVYFEQIVGRTAARSLAHGDMLTTDAIEGWNDAP